MKLAEEKMNKWVTLGLILMGIFFFRVSLSFPQGGIIKGPVPPLSTSPVMPKAVPVPQPVAPAPPSVQVPAGTGQEKGVVDPRTGEFYPGALGGVMNPRTGEILPKVEGGYLNPRTGEVVPAKP
jgi:hypothetical protein